MKSNMNIVEKGEGNALLFIHGYPLNHKIWNEQFSLSKEFHIMALDLTGFGESPSEEFSTISDYANAVFDAMEKRGTKEFIVLGHSMGGYIALEMLHQDVSANKKRIKGIALINSQTAADSEESKKGRLDTIARIQKEGKQFAIDGMKSKLFALTTYQNHSDVVALAEPILNTASPQSMIVALRSMSSRVDHSLTLKNSSVPSLVVTGLQDQIIPPDRIRALVPFNKLSEYHELDGAGHMSMMEKPNELNAIIREFALKVKG